MRIKNTARACVLSALSIIISLFVLVACGGDGGTQTNSGSTTSTDSHTSCNLTVFPNGCGVGGGSSSSGTAGGGTGGDTSDGGTVFDPKKACVITPADPTGTNLDKRCNGTCFCPNAADLEETCKSVGLATCPAGAISCARGCSLDMPMDEPAYVPLDPDKDALCIQNLSYGQWQDQNGNNDTVFLDKTNLGQYILTGYLVGGSEGAAKDWRGSIIFVGKQGISAAWRHSISEDTPSIEVHMLAPDCSSFEHKFFDANSASPNTDKTYYRTGN